MPPPPRAARTHPGTFTPCSPEVRAWPGLPSFARPARSSSLSLAFLTPLPAILRASVVHRIGAPQVRRGGSDLAVLHDELLREVSLQPLLLLRRQVCANAPRPSRCCSSDLPLRANLCRSKSGGAARRSCLRNSSCCPLRVAPSRWAHKWVVV